MVSAQEVRKQLRRVGADYHFWGAPELRELPKILFENEHIQHVINGHYTGGFATLCATDIRVLLIDKKPLFLTLEDVRYDMVSDVMFNHRFVNASLILGTVHNSISFIGFNKSKLRDMTNYIQQRVMEFRSHHTVEQQNDQQLDPLAEAEQTIITGDTAPAIGTTYQPVPAANATTVNTIPINPYKMPMRFRQRVSRY